MRALIGVLLTFAAAVALGSSVVGNWKGKVVIDASGAPKPPDAKRQREIKEGIDRLRSLVVTMTFKSDKTYTALAKGGPVKNGEKDGGTWTQAGNVVTITSRSGNQKERLTLSADGRTMTLVLPDNMGLKGKVLFSR